MRITHLTDCYLPLLGGIETQVARLAQQQAAAGHDVAVVCTTPARPGAHGVSTERDGDVTVHRLAARVPGGYPVHPRAPHHVAQVLRADRPDVVHLHMGVLTPSTQASLRTVVRAGLPAVLTVHSVWGGAERAFAGLDRVVRWSRWPVLWSAVSELTAAPLRRIVGDHGEVVVLHNGLDLDAWRVPRTERADRMEGSAVHVVAATRFAPRKRVLPFLEVVRDAVARLPEGALHVTLAGDGPELADARRFVTEHGLGSVVSLPGRLDATGLQRLYARADVFAAPAVEEAFGIAALEGQAAGLAVLTRSQSGVAERLIDGVDALVADDDAGLADALVRLATEDGLLDRIVAHNRDVPSSAGWPRVLADVERAYERAATIAVDRRARPSR
ncbi:glycosyltransferase family 4 protein [Cellulosimicrobium sp. JZ28]|uniref:glycosyltransferase family 4 protein n=1 Tax=Cellulosimicrobium sp. JZ28 TaxID=1906273 RepID=UPI00188A08BD|nr:glycosyltransferase family 4 protein [Cellulosimicrobium sp. JZ28]